MTKIIFFNGPPRSGKDTAALYIDNVAPVFKGGRDCLSVGFDKFAMPIKRAFAGMANAHIDRYGNCEPYESTKGDIIPWLGVSYRQWQIDFSEGFLKQYGKDIFARLLIQRNEGKHHDLIVVSDSGFAEEVEPVANAFGLENILLIRAHRAGCDFKGDSRSYITINQPEREHDVWNDTTIEEYNAKIDALVRPFVLGET